MSSNGLVEIVYDLRKGMTSTTLVTLERCFEQNSIDNDGSFSKTGISFDDFVAVTGKVGMFLPRQCFSRLYSYFQNQHYSEFVKALRGELSSRREAMILKTWAALSGGADTIPLAKYWDGFNPAMHPDVLSGKHTAQVIGQMQEKQVRRAGVAGTDDAVVSKQQFIDMYSNASAADPYDDDRFCQILEGVWGVVEDAFAGQIPAAFLEQVKDVLWEKVRQKTSCTSAESETLRKSLIFIDKEATGKLDYPMFLEGLEHYGVTLEDKVSSAFFMAHAKGDLVDIADFSVAICNPSVPASSVEATF